MELPSLPVPIDRYLAAIDVCRSHEAIRDTTKPFIDYESKLREVYAQYPDHPAVFKSHLVPIFDSGYPIPTVRARDPAAQSEELRDKYLLALPEEDRKHTGQTAIVSELSEFKKNFNLFSESSLVDLDWSNVVAAGSSVVTALLPVPSPHNESKRALRAYYHQTLAPASDVDLFIYGLDEEQAVEKIRSIELAIKDSILSETTTIRTKNAITIVSEYPTRHVQIVLRLYKSISEILTGFDVDCSCVAYDGNQVWATPRAMAAYITQVNTIDLTRRSPSYENRLSKYSHRGFEVFFPSMDRSRIDPTIYERSFSRVTGLARLLVLEKLPHPSDRDTYLAKRREERGRPALPWNSRFRHALPGNVKDAQPDDIAEWVEEDEVSNYHTFTVPYGPKYNAKKIEKLLFTKDLLLNAEWNKPKDRETNLHRHPAFFGSVEDVIHDCCGFCPKPETDEDLAAFEEENKVFISGKINFLKDNPGRQAIGSFHPLTDDDWTEQAYIGNTTVLCQAIVNHDLEGVVDWFSNDDLEIVDPNRRDHTGRTPLLLATMCSTSEIVQYLIDHGARMVSRLYNGLTALHIAAYRGDTESVTHLLDRSAVNEVEEDRRDAARKQARRVAADQAKKSATATESEDSGSEIDHDESEEAADELTEGSFVKLGENEKEPDDDTDDPDVFDIDVLAWDSPVSPLHLAIIAGHVPVVELLIQKYGADVLLPVKITSSRSREPHAAILTLILSLQQPLEQAKRMINTLLNNGAISTQADMNGVSALHYAVAISKMSIIQTLMDETNPNSVAKALNHVPRGSGRSYYHPELYKSPLITAIQTRSEQLATALLDKGAQPEITYEAFCSALDAKGSFRDSEEARRRDFNEQVEQPLVVATKLELPGIALKLIEAGADVNVCPTAGYKFLRGHFWQADDRSLRDLVDDKIDKLQQYLDNKSKPPKKPKQPPTLHDDQQYLDAYSKGTYSAWTASGNLAQAKFVLEVQREEYDREIDRLENQSSRSHSEEETVVIAAMIKEFKVLQSKISEGGGVTFREMFPEARQHIQRTNVGYQKPSPEGSNEPYRTMVPFDETHGLIVDTPRYLELFEAAWTNNIELVKKLTMAEKPLRITTTDQAGTSPLAIAVFRGHYELAKLILEIAAAQYRPEDGAPKYRYRLRGEDDIMYDSEYSSDEVSDDEEPAITHELVDGKFTIDDVGALSDAVQSKTSPLEYLNWDAAAWRMLNENPSVAHQMMGLIDNRFYRVYNVDDQYSWRWFHGGFKIELERTRSSLLRLAIVKNDLKMLRFILEMGQRYSSLEIKADERETTKIFSVSSTDFDAAIKLGRTEMIAEIIRRTGICLPLQTLAKKTGINLNEKPQYYQGLTVHGRKREDWAARGRGNRNDGSDETEHSVVLRAVFNGNLQSAEYFLSDSVLQRYLEFANTFKADKRLQVLAKTTGGIEKALSNWLTVRQDLVIHAAVMSAPEKDGAQPVLEYLLKHASQFIEVKNSKGDTPLHTALKLQRSNAVSLLLKANANQVARNHQGENALHMTLGCWSLDGEQEFSVAALLDLFDKSLVREMLMEKATSVDPSMTPLAMAFKRESSYESWIKACQMVFKYTKGNDLEVLDGAGDYLIHTAVREEKELHVKHLIDYRPEMLYWENATGMTPIDVAETKWLRDLIENPPSDLKQQDHDITSKALSEYGPQKYDDTPLGRAQKDVDEFLDLDPDEHLSRRKSWRLHRLLLKLAEKYRGKRRLVSVFDANEVAKRLALQQRGKNEETRRREQLGMNATGLRTGGYSRRGRLGDRAEVDDEVSMWWATAEGYKKWDWELFKEQAKRKRTKDEKDGTEESSKKVCQR